MLRKLIKFDNIGLLRDGMPVPAEFDAVTLVYAENGRGKSTLANVLRALGRLDAQSVVAGQTIDSTDAPHVHTMCEVNGATGPVTLKDGAWTGAPPDVLVFDPIFVEDNIYSGQEVRPDQRQELLKFALGSESVKLENDIAELTKKIADEQKKITDSGKRLSAFGKQMPIPTFLALQDVPDAEVQIEGLRRRVQAANNAATLAQRVGPAILPHIEIDVDAFFKILQSTFHGIQEDAKKKVQKHFAKHKATPGIEEWVTKGREFSAADGCPFCGQDTVDADLLGAYDAYFNKELDAFMEKVSVLARGVDIRFADSKIDAIQASVGINDARVETWKDQLEISPPKFDVASARAILDGLRTLTSDLALAKQRRPLDVIGTPGEKDLVNGYLKSIRDLVGNYNAEVNVISGKIVVFNRDLAAESAATLNASITRLEAVIAKRGLDAREAVAEFEAANKRKCELAQQKKDAKQALQQLLPELLKQYQNKINEFLKMFGAAFSIEELTTVSPGGILRSDYRLKLRGKSVPVGKREDKSLSFRWLLSEGDKRTLALAFFLARLHATQDGIQGKVIVLDDPVCSMDAKRRTRTMDAIGDLVAAGAQVIVLSHDAYFLNDLQEKLKGPGMRYAVRAHEIKRGSKGYSIVDSCDLALICQTLYERRYRDLQALIDGSSAKASHDLAHDLRPVVEGYFNRKYPHPLLPRDANLGQIIGHVRSAASGSPLAHAQPYLAKLTVLNDYAKQFHHDDLQPSAPINNDELLQHAMMALEIIHGDPTLH